MNTQLLVTFIIFNIINVIIQTVKSIATIKCGKTVAAFVNAVAYGLYTYIVMLTVCDLPLWIKVAVVGGANLIGVYVVKLIEEKSRKDRLWKVESSVLKEKASNLHHDLVTAKVSHNYIENVGKYTVFNIYCPTQNESQKAKEILNKYDAKYFVSESKAL